MKTNSCIDPNPMIKFEGAKDNASILNYNLPSTTSFKVKNYVTLRIPDHYWLETAIQSPVLNPFDMLQEKTQVYPPKFEAKPRIEGIKERLYIEETKIPDKVNPGDPILNPLNQPIVNDQILDPTLEELAALVPGLSALKQFARDLRQENLFLKTGIATNEAQYKSLRNASNLFNQAENIKAYKPVKSIISAKYGGLTATDVNFHAALGQLTLLKKTLYGNYEPLFISNPKKVRQKLVLIEEYEIVSFFGDYGAGKTIKTFSLLPGEKTTISIKTNRSSVETKSKTENVLDSYSQESADELETMINEENSESTTEASAEEVGFTSVEENKKSGTVSASGGGSLGIFKASASVSGSISNSDTDTNTSNSNSSRQNATNAITKGMGPSGWSLSVVDYAQFLQTLLFTEIIISDTTRKAMLTDRLGINMDNNVADSTVYSHGAWIPVGKAQVAGWFLYFERNNLLVVALSNAGHNPAMPNWYDSVKEAYAQSWQ